MKKSLYGIISILILVVVIYISTSNNSHPNTINIGAVLPFTGSSGVTGEQSKNGLELALSEINNVSTTTRKIRLLYEDSQTKTDVGLSAFLKLRDTSQIKFVITSVSGVALAVSPVANLNHIIQMDVVSASPSYSSPVDFTFRTGVSSYFFADKMSEVLLGRDIKKVGVLFVNNDYGRGYIDAFTLKYTNNGGQVMITEGYTQDAIDFRTQITKIMSSGCQAVVLASLQKETPTLLKQAEQLGLNLPLYSDVYAAEQTENLKLKISENMFYLKPKVDFSANSIAVEFRTKYLERFKVEPTFIAAQAYDGLMLLARSMNNCVNPEDTVCVRNSLYNIKKHKGVISENIAFDANGDIADRPLELKTIRDGAFVVTSF
jgi:branched-chain amino acid transport system substrate-binding protein